MFTHQLGMIAELRGDYTAAENRYQQSRTILEELGDRAGIASTTSQLGVLYTTQGRIVDAIPYNLTALSIRLSIESSEAGIDIHWLKRQREAIPGNKFRTVLADHLSPNNIIALINLLDSATEE